MKLGVISILIETIEVAEITMSKYRGLRGTEALKGKLEGTASDVTGNQDCVASKEFKK